MSAEHVAFLLRWLHVLSAVMLAGLLLFVNFVQIPSFAKLVPEDRLVIARVIGHAALLWLRCSAVAVAVTGLALAGHSGYLGDALLLGLAPSNPRDALIGFGMWIGLIMVAILWLVIWPAMRRFEAADTSPEERGALAGRAIKAARINLMPPVPLSYAMVGAQNLY